MTSLGMEVVSDVWEGDAYLTRTRKIKGESSGSEHAKERVGCKGCQGKTRCGILNYVEKEKGKAC